MGLKCKGTRIFPESRSWLNTVQVWLETGPGRKKSQTSNDDFGKRGSDRRFDPSEIPTVVRDIIYGWARGFVGVAMASVFKPQTFTQEAAFEGGRQGRLVDFPWKNMKKHTRSS